MPQNLLAERSPTGANLLNLKYFEPAQARQQSTDHKKEENLHPTVRRWIHHLLPPLIAILHLRKILIHHFRSQKGLMMILTKRYARTQSVPTYPHPIQYSWH
jgi:hypothetical protein